MQAEHGNRTRLEVEGGGFARMTAGDGFAKQSLGIQLRADIEFGQRRRVGGVEGLKLLAADFAQAAAVEQSVVEHQADIAQARPGCQLQRRLQMRHRVAARQPERHLRAGEQHVAFAGAEHER